MRKDFEKWMKRVPKGDIAKRLGHVAEEALKGAVTEVYAGKLREAIVEKMKADPNTKIEIMK